MPNISFPSPFNSQPGEGSLQFPPDEAPPVAVAPAPAPFTAPAEDVNAAAEAAPVEPAPRTMPGRSSMPATPQVAPQVAPQVGGFTAPAADVPFQAPEQDQKQGQLKSLVQDRSVEQIALDKEKIPDLKAFYLEHATNLPQPELDKLGAAHVARIAAGIGGSEIKGAVEHGWDFIKNITKGAFKSRELQNKILADVAKRVMSGKSDEEITKDVKELAGESVAGFEGALVNTVGLVRGLIQSQVNSEGTRAVLGKLGIKNDAPRFGADVFDPAHFATQLTPAEQLIADSRKSDVMQKTATGEGVLSNFTGLDASSLDKIGVKLDPDAIAFNTLALDPVNALVFAKGLQIASAAGRAAQITDAAGKVVASATTREAAQTFIQRVAQAAESATQRAGAAVSGVGRGPAMKAVGAFEALQGSPGLAKLAAAWTAKQGVRAGLKSVELGARAVGSELGSRAIVAGAEGAAHGSLFGAAMAAATNDPQEQADLITISGGLGALTAAGGTVGHEVLTKVRKGVQSVVNSATSAKSGLLSEIPATTLDPLNTAQLGDLEQIHQQNRASIVDENERRIGDYNRALMGEPEVTEPGTAPKPPKLNEPAPIYYLTEEQAIALDPGLAGKEGAHPVTITDAAGNQRKITYVRVDNGHVTGAVHEPSHFWFKQLLTEKEQADLLASFSDKQAKEFSDMVESNPNYTADQKVRAKANARLELAVDSFGHQLEGRGLEGLPQTLKDKMLFLAAQGLERLGIYNPDTINARPNAQGNVTRGGVEVPTEAARIAREGLNRYLNDPAVKAKMDELRAQSAAQNPPGTPPAAPPAAPGAPVVPVVPSAPAGPTPEQTAQDNLVTAVRKQFPKVADRYETILAKARRGEALTPGEQAQYDSIVAEAARLGGARPAPATPAPAPIHPNPVSSEAPPVIRPAPKVTESPVNPGEVEIKPAPRAEQPELLPTTPATAPKPPNVRGVTEPAYSRFVGPAREPAQQRARSAVNAIAKDPNLSPEVVAANKQLLENLGTPHEIVYDSAAETGSKAEGYRKRREEIKNAQDNPNLRAAASKLGVIPLDVNQIADGHQIQVWSGDAALVNMDRVLAQAKGKLESQIPYPMENGKLKDNGAQLAQDVIDYTRNQNNGYKGDGTPLNRPANPKGFIPDVNPDFVPVKLSEDVANFANLLMGERPPKIARVTPPTVPVPVRANEIARANARPGTPTGLEFKVEPYKGEGINDFNPKRVAMEKAGFNLKDLNPVHERLNVNRIKSATPRPDIKLEPTATDVTAAGFMAQREGEAAPIQTDRRKTGQAFASFFSSVIKGEFGKSNVPYEAGMDMSKQQAFVDTMAKHSGGFGEHIAKSIPNYLESGVKIGDAVVKTFPEGANVLDIGSSEGYWGKAVTEMSDGKIKTTSLDTNPDMEARFNETPVEGAKFTTDAFKEGYEDNGKMVPAFKPDEKFDVVNEGMTFQFINNDRPAQLAEVKRLMKPDGIFITRQKVLNENWKANEVAKDTKWKNKYFSKDELAAKEEKVGFQQSKQEEKAVGMVDNMVTDKQLEKDLGEQFKYVSQIWDSGNFKGYAAGDDIANLGAFIKNTGSLNTDFSNVKTPRPVETKQFKPLDFSRNPADKRQLAVPGDRADYMAKSNAGKRAEETGYKFVLTTNPDTGLSTLQLSDPKLGNIGFVQFDKSGDTGKIKMVNVDPELQNQGLGELLYKEAITHLKEQGATKLTGDVVHDAPMKIRRKLLGEPTVSEPIGFGSREVPHVTNDLTNAPDFMAKKAPSKFWLEKNAEVRDAEGDHGRFAAKELGLDFHPDKRGKYESAKMSKGAVRGNRQDGVLFLDGDRPWSELSRTQRDKIQDIAFDTGDAVNYNGKFIEGFGPDGGGAGWDFMAKKKDKANDRPTGWILPDGKFKPVSDFHERDLATNAKKYNEQFGTNFSPEADTLERFDALKSGFVRMRSTPNGDMTVEVGAAHWDRQKKAIKKQLLGQADNINNLSIAVLDDRGKVIANVDDNIFKSKDAERSISDTVDAVKLPSGKASAEPTLIQRARALPDAPDYMAKPAKGQLEFGKPTPAEDNYDRALISNMTQKELKAHWPEAIVVAEKDGKKVAITSDLADSPLVKEHGYDKAAQVAGDKLVERVKEAGNDPDMELGRTWYSRFHKPLRRFFGEDAQVFTEMLAATSPQTQPKQNFETAWEAFRLYKAGWFDDLVTGFKRGLDKTSDGSLMKEYLRKVPKSEQPANISDATLMRWWMQENDLKPTKAPRLNKDADIEDSVMFNSQSEAVLKVAARQWMEKNGGLKTNQFVRNLLDLDHGATIDLWADRTMREITHKGYVNRWRILPENGAPVKDADFHFAQAAFKHAADKLGWKPSEVQGALWFLEKRRWAKEGWSPLNLGDYLPHLEELASKGTLDAEIAKVPKNRSAALADLKIQRKQAVQAQKQAAKEQADLEVAIRKAEKAQLGFDMDFAPKKR